VQRVAPKLPLLLSNAFELMCLFCAPGTHDQKCTAVSFISTCYFAKVVANTLCDVGFAPRGLRFRVTRILEIGVPMTRDSVESWIKSHILSNSNNNKYKDLIVLDSAANVDVFNNPQLVNNIKIAPSPIKVGTNNGTKSLNLTAQSRGRNSAVWFDSTASWSAKIGPIWAWKCDISGTKATACIPSGLGSAPFNMAGLISSVSTVKQ
jgi:hypothetical protein